MNRGRVYHFRRRGSRDSALCTWNYRANVAPVEYSLSPVFSGGRRLLPCEHCLSVAWESEHQRAEVASFPPDPVWMDELYQQWLVGQAMWEAACD